MTAILTLLFAAAASCAVAVLVDGLRGFPAAARLLARQLRDCVDVIECRYAVTEPRLRPAAASPAALRREFRLVETRRPVRPRLAAPALRAAA